MEQIETVQALAFITPDWDYHINFETKPLSFLYAPTNKKTGCIGYTVWGWEYEEQRWIRLECVDDESEARAIAREWDDAARVAYDLEV